MSDPAVLRCASGSGARRQGLGRVVFDNGEELVALGLLCIIGGIMLLQVVMRTLFASPLSWPEELSQFLFAWCSLLGAVGAGKRCGLVCLDLVTQKLPARLQAASKYASLVLIAALLAVLGWNGYQLTTRTSFSAATLPITWAWAYAAAPVFSVLMIIRLVQLDVFRYRYTFIETWLGAHDEPAERKGERQ